MGDKMSQTVVGTRIERLDILRGWAVWGMVVVNVAYFSRHPLLAPEGADVVVAILIQFLAIDKFWTLFSVLFGYGFVLQMDRSLQRGDPFVSLYARRMLVLALLGVSHAMLHPSEVLHRYALLGFALVLLRHRSTSVLVGAAAASIAATIAWPGGGDAVEPMVRAAVFADGSLGDVLAFNAATFFSGVLDTRLLEPLPYFVVGVLLGRRRILHDGDRYRGLIRRARWWLGGLGALLQFSLGLMVFASSATARRYLVAVVSALGGIGSGLFGLLYAAVIVLVVERPQGRRVLRPLAAVGRLALTNYLAQTVVVTTLLYGYGFGLYGRIGMLEGLLIAVAVFGLQTAASVWWVARFQSGPVEWVWRTLAGSPYNDAAYRPSVTNQS